MDLEGVAGVADPADVTPGSPTYDECRRLMVAECSAVVAGCVDAGATDVVVNDAHASMANLLASELDPRARVVRGWAKPHGMLEGIDEGVDVAMFVGYHAAAGSARGVLSHTMSSEDILGVLVNTEPAGELRMNAALAGTRGVPVVMVSGDDVVCREAKECLPRVEAVEVKRAIDRQAACSLHPERARALLSAGAARALRMERPRPYVVESPTSLVVEWVSPTVAALCTSVPGVERISARAVRAVSEEFDVLYRLFLALGAIARSTRAL